MSKGNITTDHEHIKRWVDERGGFPARVEGTMNGADPGILRIDFPGYEGEDTLERIAWEHWLRAFDEHQLAFVYQDRTDDGELSRFNKLVRRDTA